MTARDAEVEGAVAELASRIFGAQRLAPTADPRRAIGAAGLYGLGLAEAEGGAGGTHVMAGLVAEVAGRELLPGPYLHQQIGVHVLAGWPGHPLLAEVVAGRRAVDVAVDDAAAGLTWRAPFALPCASATDFLLIGPSDTAVLVAAADVRHRTDTETWSDPQWGDTVVDAPMTFRDARDIGPGPLDLANGLAAMAMIGATSLLLTRTVGYVSERRQFGAPVGSFQAVKHALAAVLIDNHHARALAVGALHARDDGDPDAPVLLAMAKAAANASVDSVRRCLQAHGGIGFTWESDVHLYLKQVMRLRQWPRAHLRLRADLRQSCLVGSGS